jgi:hypothetical protein
MNDAVDAFDFFVSLPSEKCLINSIDKIGIFGASTTRELSGH